MTASNRRGFLKELLRTGVEIAQELSSAVRTEAELVPAPDPEPWTGLRFVPAEPVPRTASLQELSDLCSEVGLSPARTAAAKRLVRPSLRLTPAESRAVGPAASRFGGVPDLPPAFQWPRWGGRSLAFLGQINLGEEAAREPEAGIPSNGLLLFFYDVQQQPSGLDPAHRGSCHVVILANGEPLEPDPEGRAWFAEQPLAFSQELTLPAAHSVQVGPLGLDYEERTAWNSLRERLAALQGVVLEESSTEWFALNRLLGYPDPVHAGEIELDCQLVANGLDLTGGDGYLDPRRDELEPGAADWRLLLQLSVDSQPGSEWGQSLRRLYLWIREPALRSGDFGQVWPILQQ